jgi:hypothetical protein
VRKDADQQVAAGVGVKGYVHGRLTQVTAAHGRCEWVAVQQAVSLRFAKAVAQHLSVVCVDGNGRRVAKSNGCKGEHGASPVGKGCVVVPLLPQASAQEVQLVPGGAALAGLQVVPSVREAVYGEAELRGVERKGFQQEAELLEPGDRGLVVRRLPQQLVEALAEKGVDGFRGRETLVLWHGETTPGFLVE